MKINSSDGFGTAMMLLAGFAVGLTSVFMAVASNVGKGEKKEPANVEGMDRKTQGLLKLDPVQMN